MSSKLLKAFGTISSLTLVSRVLGFIRDMLMASALGAGVIADAFLVAFKLPNLFRRLFAEGAFSAAFIPLFNECLTKGLHDARLFAGRALFWLSSALISLLILAEIFMPQVIVVLAPGFIDDPERLSLAISLGYITFPYLLAISLVALFTGILNSIDKFSYGAISPVLLNIMMIGALLLPYIGREQAFWLSVAVSISGFLQLGWMFYGAVKHGVVPIMAKPFITDNTRRLLKLMLPAMLGAGVYQLNIMVDIFFASLLPAGAVSWLYYADRLAQLPLGVIGIALGSALLPILSKKLKSGSLQEALNIQQQAIKVCLFFALPCMVGLFMLAAPILGVLFERGAFSRVDTLQTAYALQIFAIGLPATLLNKVFLSTCFAMQDTKTPVKIAVVALIINIVLNILLWQPLGHIGIAIATTTSAWVSLLIIVIYLLQKKLLGFERLGQYLLKIALLSIIMSAPLIILHNQFTLLSLLTQIVLAGVVFIGGAVLMKVIPLKGKNFPRKL